MSTKRADPMDLSDFEVKPAARPRPPLAAVREASEEQNFVSREPAHPHTPPAQQIAPAPVPGPGPAAKVEQRRRRTGRSYQLNLKVTKEAADQLKALADAQGWGLGEAFEKAVGVLAEKHAIKG